MTCLAPLLEEPRRLFQSTPERRESRNLSDIQSKQYKQAIRRLKQRKKTIFNGFYAFFLIYRDLNGLKRSSDELVMNFRRFTVFITITKILKYFIAQ